MKSITRSVLLGLAVLLSGGAGAGACPRCRPFVNAGVYNPHFAGHLLVTLLPVLLLLAIGAGLYFVDAGPRAPRG